MLVSPQSKMDEGNFMYFLFALLSLSLTAHADDQPGFQKDFNYQVTELKSMGEAQALENLMTTDTRQKSICANRAHLWANDLARMRNIQTGKVFIHFTAKGEASENGDWAYHVAPYVIVKGEEVVLDPGFGVFHGKPVKLTEWTKYFGKSEKCIVLDPMDNPAHLALEKNDVGSDDVNPLSNRFGTARQYPSTEGICYIRKTPMYYQFPVAVYGVDLLHSGKAEYASYNLQSFDQDSVLMACQQATTLSFKMKHDCSSYLGIKKDPPRKKKR